MFAFSMAVTVDVTPVRAEGQPVVPVVPAPVVAERSMLPNPALFGSGFGLFVVGYTPALVVGAASDHKGDRSLLIPVVGPFIDLGTRACSGLTLDSSNGPFQLSDGKNCGASGIEQVALVADGIVQALAAVEIAGSFLVPERQTTVVVGSRRASLSIAPSSFGGRGAGAVALGIF
jgi:hypothetical protein